MDVLQPIRPNLKKVCLEYTYTYFEQSIPPTKPANTLFNVFTLGFSAIIIIIFMLKSVAQIKKVSSLTNFVDV